MAELILILKPLLRLVVVAFFVVFIAIPVVVYILSGVPMKKRGDITFWAEETAYIILIISLWE